MTIRVLGLGVLLLLSAACTETESTPTASAEENNEAVTALAAVYDTAMDISGFGSQGHAYGISDAGLVVGDNNGLPFSWQQPFGPITTLTLPTTLNLIGGATSISSSGRWIAGYGGPGSGISHAVVWDGHRNPVDLGTLGGGSSYANAVDDKGTVVGWSETAHGTMHAFRYTRATGMVDLGILPGAAKSAQMMALDLNAKEIVGCGNGPSGSYDMWTWTPAHGFKNLGTGLGFTCANAVNTKNVIAGSTDQMGAGGFTWSASLGFVLHPGTDAAHDINTRGFAAGEAGGFRDAYVADPHGGVVFLPRLAPTHPFSSASAWGINVCGDVVGWSSNPFIGETHAIWWPGHRCP